jgi:hypothetical protein
LWNITSENLIFGICFLIDFAQIKESQHEGAQVTGQVTIQIGIQILAFCLEPRKASEIQKLLQLKHRETFQNNYLRPLLNAQLLALTIADKPNSRLQRYIITKAGRKWLEEHQE